jgi:protein-S-isoprenylcysteine O-methyltransferase Ste14
MVRRLIKVLSFMAVFYVIPLAAHPALIFDARIVLLMLVCAVVLLSQPELSLREARRDAAADGYSVLAIMAGASVSQVAPVIEWTRRADHEGSVAWIIVGAAMLLGGTAFRIWAIQTLGRYFTATVSIKDGHELVKTGPYRFVRHPSYLGAYVAMIGSAVLLEAPISVAITALVMGIAYTYRILREEKTLLQHFGNARS